MTYFAIAPERSAVRDQLTRRPLCVGSGPMPAAKPKGPGHLSGKAQNGHFGRAETCGARLLNLAWTAWRAGIIPE